MPSEILIATINVGNGRANPYRLGALFRKYKIDLVGLQEVSDEQAETLDLEIAADFPFRSIFPGGFAGKAIFSRYPILTQEQIHFGSERPDLVVVMDINNIKITVLSAHPPPPKVRKSGYHFDPDTRKQIELLAGYAIEFSPSILLGDFNLVEKQNEYRTLSSGGLQDAFKIAGRGFGNTLPRRLGPWRKLQWLNKLLRWIPLIPVARVDYIWFTEPLKCLSCWVADDIGSDHLPVLAQMQLP